MDGQAIGWVDLHAPASSEDDMPPRSHHPLALIGPVRLVIVAQGHGAAIVSIAIVSIAIVSVGVGVGL